MDDKADILNKANVITRELSLANIQEVLTEGFKVLEKIRGANIVLVIGNTGSGKSTMLSSLLKGPDALEIKQIKFTIDVPNKEGVMVRSERTKKVIDNKEASPTEDFIIGHSSVNSETFLPKFLYDYQNDVYFGDIAGLQDTSGPLIDFINSFLVKKIFQLANSVRFLYVMTKKQMKEMRGMQIRQQIRVLQAMCSTVDINDVHNSIKPVITKVKTGELADDEDERSLEDYRQVFVDAAQAEIEMLRNQDAAKDREIEELNALNANGGDAQEENQDQQALNEDAQNSKEKKYEEM